MEKMNTTAPAFEDVRNSLPAPVYNEKPDYVESYWKAWELAFKNTYVPSPEAGFVSPFVDAAFNDSIFLWDMSFISMFANYGMPFSPGIVGLDNFYAKQHATGEICRQISRINGNDDPRWTNTEGDALFSRYGTNYRGDKMPVNYRECEAPTPPPRLTLDALNHPILSWAELTSYALTGDTARLEKIRTPLVRYYEALRKYLRQGNGLYITDWASMDNSPRNRILKGGGTGIDISSEMVLFARDLAQIAQLTGRAGEAAEYLAEADALAALINEKMWSNTANFYYDLSSDDELGSCKTIAGFWPLIAGVADSEKAGYLEMELNNEDTFNRQHRVPTLAGTDDAFTPEGGYWKGAVWAPTNTMVVKGLEKYGFFKTAREIALNHLECVNRIYKETGTFWENYAPDQVIRGRPSRRDFVGWTGIAPIAYFLEYAIGLQANASKNTIVWNISSEKELGVVNYRFGGRTVDLVLQEKNADGKRPLEVRSDGDLTLKIVYKDKAYDYNIVAYPNTKETATDNRDDSPVQPVILRR